MARMLLKPWICLFYIVSPVVGPRFDFIVDNDDIFERCPDRPNVQGIRDFVNLSEFTIEFNEGYISGWGQMTMHWEGVEATDRVDVRFSQWRRCILEDISFLQAGM